MNKLLQIDLNAFNLMFNYDYEKVYQSTISHLIQKVYKHTKNN
jgi:hypothetical protein